MRNLTCVPISSPPWTRSPAVAGRAAARAAAAAAGGFAAVVAGLLAGAGWLYVLRGLGWLGLGPRVGDALPLLQLAGTDGQPLLRVLTAWLLAGLVTGVALIMLSPPPRALVTLLLGLALLLLGAQAAYALARNLPLGAVLFAHDPGLGPVLEAVLLAAGALLPRPLPQRDPARQRSRPSLAPSLWARRLGHRRLRGG